MKCPRPYCKGFLYTDEDGEWCFECARQKDKPEPLPKIPDRDVVPKYYGRVECEEA